MARILIIEDDTDLREGLEFALLTEKYEVDTAGTVREGMDRICTGAYDCVLLDCNLPDGSGFGLCRDVREFSDIFILMLTARDSEMDEVKALELGVDDYMSKPFSVAVLKARIRKLLSRREGKQQLSSNGIVLDKSECRAYKDGEEIVLSRTEYKLLLYFMENPDQVLSKEQILERIWDKDGRFVDENTVSVNIRRLRRRIEKDAGKPEYIRTVHGFGYLWHQGTKGAGN